MRIAILSRNPNLHSIQRLLQEAKKQKISCDIIDPLSCQLIVDGQKSDIRVGSRSLPRYDAVLPRIGASITDYGLAVVKQFEILGITVINGSTAISQSRDKMRSLQLMASAGLSVPATVLTRDPKNLKSAIASVKGMPVVMKLLQGTQGVGVMLVHTPISLGSVLDAVRGLGKDLLLQQFVAEGAGRDYRVFVVGGKVVATMMRTAPEGEFRTNIHRGGAGAWVDLPREYERTAIAAAHSMGLDVAGVDLMESEDGPLVIEVNSSPGFEGIERSTGLNIAKVVIEHIKKRAKAARHEKTALRLTKKKSPAPRPQLRVNQKKSRSPFTNSRKRARNP